MIQSVLSNIENKSAKIAFEENKEFSTISSSSSTSSEESIYDLRPKLLKASMQEGKTAPLALK